MHSQASINYLKASIFLANSEFISNSNRSACHEILPTFQPQLANDIMNAYSIPIAKMHYFHPIKQAHLFLNDENQVKIGR